MTIIKKGAWLFVIVCLMALISIGCANSTQTQTSNDTSADSPQQQSASAAEQKPKSDKKIELRFSTGITDTSPEWPIIESIFSEFQEEYPNVSIKVEVTPGYEQQTKMQLDATSNRMPDFFSYWRPDPAYGLDKMIESGLVADLTEFTSDPEIHNLFPESAWETASKNGRVYGVPLKMFYIYILANKEVLDQSGVDIPETWEDWIQAMDKIKEAGYIPWGASILDDHGVRLFDLVFSRVLTNERGLNMFAGNEPINVPEVVEAAKRLQELVVGNIPPDSIAIDNNAMMAKYINAGKAAFIIDISGSRLVSYEEALGDNLVALEFPLIPGGAQTEKRVEQDLTQLFYASAKSWEDADKGPYIRELLIRLTSNETGKAYADAGVPVPHLEVEADVEKIGRIVAETQSIALNNMANRWLPKVMEADKRARFEPMLAEFLNGQYTPEDFVEQLHELFYVE